MPLIIEELQVSYGRALAVRNVSIVVEPGEIVSIVGPNGAGKSTTLLAISGALRPRSGRILLDGASLLPLTPEQRVSRDLALVPEGREIFRTLTVAENLQVARNAGRAKSAGNTAVDNVLSLFPVLRDRYRQPAGHLSGGEQQQLAIARALMSEPKYLLIDEPSLGLAPLMVKRVYDLLTELRQARGLSILLVEQSMRRVLATADRVYVMRDGLTSAVFNRDQFKDEKLLEQAYFGLPA
jgi:branched-chain amino acid transport system ATP-binding protein